MLPDLAHWNEERRRMIFRLLVTIGFCTATATSRAEMLPPPPATNTTQARAQLRHCAAEWNKMKRSGEASGKLWRDFAPGCMKK